MKDPVAHIDQPSGARRWLRRSLWGLGVLGVAMVVLNVWVYGDFTPPLYEPKEPLPGVGSLSAQQCRACHAAIYEEWAQSGHARAFVDPLYQAELQHQPSTFVCHRCHTPLVEQRPSLVYGLWAVWPRLIPVSWSNDRFDESLQSEGVTCVACHQVDGHMVGPFSDPQGAPHPTKVGELRAVTTCARCHQFGFERIGRLDRPIIDTMTEWEGYREQGGDKRCADCHLPIQGQQPLFEGGPSRPHTNHALLGPFNPQFVATGVVVEDLQLGLDPQTGATASVTIFNGTGHRLPSAEPQRYIRVHLSAQSADGTVLADDEVRFERPVDVARLRELGPDTTLAPRERKPVALALPMVPADAARIEVAVDFHLWHADDAVATDAGMSAAQLVHRIAVRTAEVP
ncbi:MAG: hypothetical protein K0V04_09845 [Deltaproteobacteria bacterium]|nr:hypothetical protein [Deltaproteobacteria bacterium]